MMGGLVNNVLIIVNLAISIPEVPVLNVIPVKIGKMRIIVLVIMDFIIKI